MNIKHNSFIHSFHNVSHQSPKNPNNKQLQTANVPSRCVCVNVCGCMRNSSGRNNNRFLLFASKSSNLKGMNCRAMDGCPNQ